MQNKKLEEIKEGLQEKKTSSMPDILVSGEAPLGGSIDLGRSEIKTNDGFNLLGVILETAFFYTLFEYIASRQFRSKSLSLRVAKLKTVHPNVYQFCIVADVVVRVIVVIALLLAAFYSLWKVLR